jgi:hypothetical protein
MAVCNLEELQNAGVFQVIGESGREGSKKPAMYLIEWNKKFLVQVSIMVFHPMDVVRVKWRLCSAR